ARGGAETVILDACVPPSAPPTDTPVNERVLEVRKSIEALATRQRRRIVLPEAAIDGRTIRAAAMAHERGVAAPVLLGDPTAIGVLAEGEGIDLSPLEVLVPYENPDLRERLA